MTTFNKSVFINIAAEDAFTFITDNEFFNRWMPGVLSSVVTTKGPLKINSTLTQRMKIHGPIDDIAGRVTTFETDKKWGYTGQCERYFFQRTWTIEPLIKGSKIHLNDEITKKGKWGFLKWFFFRSELEKLHLTSLEELKRDLETPGSRLSSLTGR